MAIWQRFLLTIEMPLSKTQFRATPQTITDAHAQRPPPRGWPTRDTLLTTKKRRRHALCAAAIRNHSGEVVGAISISAPASRMPEDKVQELGVLVNESVHGFPHPRLQANNSGPTELDVNCLSWGSCRSYIHSPLGEHLGSWRKLSRNAPASPPSRWFGRGFSDAFHNNKDGRKGSSLRQQIAMSSVPGSEFNNST